MTKVLPDLVVTQILRGYIVVFGQASDSANVTLLGLLAELVKFHVVDEFLLNWIIGMIYLPVEMNRNGTAYSNLSKRQVEKND